MFAKFLDFLADESGATSIEYGIIAALVSVVSIGALDALGGDLIRVFDTAATNIGPADTGIESVSPDATVPSDPSALPAEGTYYEDLARVQ